MQRSNVGDSERPISGRTKPSSAPLWCFF